MIWGGTTGKHSFCDLAFMVPEADMQAYMEGKQPIFLPNYDAYEPQKWLVRHDNPKGTVVANMLGRQSIVS